jgi:hypothetical protein
MLTSIRLSPFVLSHYPRTKMVAVCAGTRSLYVL